jgi:hypothetical protein
MALTIFTGRQFTAASRHSDKLIDRCGKLPPHCCILAPAKAPRNELLSNYGLDVKLSTTFLAASLRSRRETALRVQGVV